MSGDVLSVLTGYNRFVLRAHKAQELKLLQGMKHNALASMKHLVIRLNCWPCPRGHIPDQANCYTDNDTCSKCNSTLSHGDPVLGLSKPESRELLEGWRVICKNLSAAVPAGQLTMPFVCDTDNLDTAKNVVQPLLTLPKLRNCAIRLGRRPNLDLSALAESTS